MKMASDCVHKEVYSQLKSLVIIYFTEAGSWYVWMCPITGAKIKN